MITTDSSQYAKIKALCKFAHTIELVHQDLARRAHKCLVLGLASGWSREKLTSRKLPKQFTSQHPEIPLLPCTNQTMAKGVARTIVNFLQAGQILIPLPFAHIPPLSLCHLNYLHG
jgi:hypothetical protein